MELHQLRYFVAVARTGNFTRAAAECHVSQPSLSQQIQKLEDELGERLVDRMKRSSRLTAHGEVFLPRALAILSEVEAALREAGESRGLLRGAVSLGILPTIAPYLLPPVLAAFSQKFPGVSVEVREDTTERLIELLTTAQLDLALASDPITDARLASEAILTEELLLALPARHRLSQKRSIAAGDLGTERLIVLKEGHCLGDQVLNFCASRDLKPAVSFRSAQLETIQSLVREGLGISLIPAMATKVRQDSGIVYRSLGKPRPSRRVQALWLRSRPPGRAARELLSAFLAQKRNIP